MESRFNKDFSNVRIHSDNEAVALSTHLNAQAFTVGNDIVVVSYYDVRIVDALLEHDLNDEAVSFLSSVVYRGDSFTEKKSKKLAAAIVSLYAEEEMY